MKLSANIPSRSQLLARSCIVMVARRGKSWSKNQLKTHADSCGVYIHFSRSRIIYVGKTSKKTGDEKPGWATFGERLRREFQYTSSQNSHLHQLLSAKSPIKTTLIDLEETDHIIRGNNISTHRKALILEQILIAVFEPTGNRI
jgi:hypothetical protein